MLNGEVQQLNDYPQLVHRICLKNMYINFKDKINTYKGNRRYVDSLNISNEMNCDINHFLLYRNACNIMIHPPSNESFE
jgi:hypothetical protein